LHHPFADGGGRRKNAVAVEPRADVAIVARHKSQPMNPPADLDDLSTQLVFGSCHRSTTHFGAPAPLIAELRRRSARWCISPPTVHTDWRFTRICRAAWW